MNQREIKFRAWDKEAKRMVYGGIVNFCTPVQTIEMPLGDLHKHTIAVHPSRPYDLMQFTGLKDNKGKEIYEGDILGGYNPRYEASGGALSVVKWDEENALFAILRGGTTSGYTFAAEMKWSEVIGNIYENSELLNK